MHVRGAEYLRVISWRVLQVMHCCCGIMLSSVILERHVHQLSYMLVVVHVQDAGKLPDFILNLYDLSLIHI